MRFLAGLMCLVVLVAPSVARECVCGATSDGSGVNIRTCGSTSCR